MAVPYLDDSALDLYKTYGFKGYTDNPLTNKIVDLSMVRVRGTVKLYPVFEEISVYDNINKDFFSASLYNGETQNGVELTLIKEVKGKITVPATFMFNGSEQPVLSINASFGATTNAYSGFTALGKNLTHVFFAKSNDPTKNTQIENFASYSFFGHGTLTNYSKLKFVEFPDTLKSIGNYCFSRCGSLDYGIVENDPNARIKGSNVTTIGEYAFLAAFKPKNVVDLKIGSSVTSIGGSGFRNMNLTYSNLLIGDSNNLSNLSFPVGYDTTARFNYAADVVFHSNLYDAGDVDKLSPFFSGCNSLTVY